MDKNKKKELMDIYRKLRVADVRDGMDYLMLHHVGTVSGDIKPLWRTHFCGFARTVQYVPFEGVIPNMTPEEYHEYINYYYEEIGSYPFQPEIEEYDVVVIDQSDLNVGIIGSNNSLKWIHSGARGIITNGGPRDTDEIIIQKVPVFSRSIAQTMVQGRVRFQAKDIPVNIAGTVVRPNDIIVADGDGVIVVPIEKAAEIAKYAMRELENDKKGRRMMYEIMNMQLDDTVL